MKQELNIKKNFYSDWISILKNEIESLGYTLDSEIEDRDISILYFNIQRRKILPKKRDIQISNEFSCSEEFKDGIDLIKQKIEKGEDLYPHQSTGILDPSYNDSLLNDWDIHHLHLGTSVKENGFVERTGPVLFVRVTDDTVYLIDVLRHGRGYQPWIKQKVFQTIHNNWPDSVSQFKLYGIHSVEHNPDDSEIGTLRKANVNVILQMDDGTFYAPIGGGLMTSGVSLEVMKASDYYAKLVRNIEDYVEDNFNGLIKLAEDKDVSLGRNPHFKLIEIQKDFCLVLEMSSRYAFKIPIG